MQGASASEFRQESRPWSTILAIIDLCSVLQKQLFMQKQASTSSIKVFVRVRPMVSSQRGSDQVVEVLSDNRTVRVTHDSYNHLEITFDHAFDSSVNQDSVYDRFITVVPRVLDGYNVTIFAYGQTGSGKTFTMFGANADGQEILQAQDFESDTNSGVIPRAINQVFNKFKSMRNASIFCSFLQIYNEKIYDLLQDNQKPNPLSIHQSKVQGIFVEGLTEFGVEKAQDCLQLLMKGVKNRVVRQTSMNAKSSRSHSIFQLLVEIQEGSGSFLKGRLNLCDLAGSQKINKKQGIGNEQLKELKNINLSLTTLGKVIYALSGGDKKVGGVFRQSKLTRLLQESLTGNTYTFIMANLSPSIKNLQETINTLKFVERANHITLRVKPTEISGANPDTVSKLQKEIEYLKELLDMKKKGINPEQMANQLRLMKKQNDVRNKAISKQQFQSLLKQNRQMKKEIQTLQVKLEQTEGSNTSYSDKQAHQQQKQHLRAQEKRQYYMPSSRAPSSSNTSNSRLSSSLIKAGQSIVFQHSTIEDAASRNKEKRNLVHRLQQFQDKKKNEEYKLIEEYQMRLKNRYSPVKPEGKGKIGKREDSVMLAKNRKRVDYTDRIKQLQARLFGK